MPVKRIITEGCVPIQVYTQDIEAQALNQLINISQLPIIPAAVEVDIGCGMSAVRLSLFMNCDKWCVSKAKPFLP